MPRVLRVSYLQRAAGVAHSVERLFQDVRSGLPDDIEASVWQARYGGANLLKVLVNAILATRHQGEVNHITGDAYYLAAFLPRRRTVVTFLDCVGLERYRGWRRRMIHAIWYWMPSRRAGVITAISEASRDDAARYLNLPRERIHVVPCCVSGLFTHRPAGAFPSRPRVLQIGTTPHKNIERVAAALAGLPCTLRIIGRPSPSQVAALEAHGIEYTVAANLTPDEVVAEYAAADMVVFASTYEGFGLPILEAQAVGRPVVTSRLQPMAWVAGDAAWLVDPLDPASIREGVLRVMRDSAYREEIVARGLENVKRFSAERVAAQYAEIYRELAGAGDR